MCIRSHVGNMLWKYIIPPRIQMVSDIYIIMFIFINKLYIYIIMMMI